MTPLARVVALAAAGGLLALVLLAPFALTVDPRSGLSPALSEGRIVRAAGIPASVESAGVAVELAFARPAALDPARDAFLIVGPTVGFRDEEVIALRGFLSAGGRVLLADDHGVGADLLERLAVGIASSTTPVYSPGFQGDPDRLITRSTGALADLPAEVVLSRPALVTGGEPLLLAPELAWLDLNDNGRPDLEEPLRSGALAARAPVGQGELIVVGDADAFAPTQLDTARALLAALGGDGERRIVVDQAHHALSDPLGANALLAGRLGIVAATGILMLTAVLATAAVLNPRLRRVAPPLTATRARGPGVSDVLEELE